MGDSEGDVPAPHSRQMNNVKNRVKDSVKNRVKSDVRRRVTFSHTLFHVRFHVSQCQHRLRQTSHVGDERIEGDRRRVDGERRLRFRLLRCVHAVCNDGSFTSRRHGMGLFTYHAAFACASTD